MAGFSAFIPEVVKNGNGKRERMDQEEDQEFMPLSKRINNIHLSPERQVNGHSQHHPNNHSVNGHGGHPVPTTSSTPPSVVHLNGLGPPVQIPLNPHQYSHQNPAGSGSFSSGFEEDSHNQLSSFVHHAQQFQNRHHHQHHHQGTSSHGSNYVNGGLPHAQIGNFNSERNLSRTRPSGSTPVVTSSYNVPDENSVDTRRFEYRPSLNESSNPYYYEPNRTLFNLYIERICRQNQCPHPDVFSRTNE